MSATLLAPGRHRAACPAGGAPSLRAERDALVGVLAGEGRKLLDLAFEGEAYRTGVVPVPERAVRDAAELWQVVARLLRGRTPLEVSRAFGAPGDWGYDTPVGAALKRFYDAINRAANGGAG